MERPKTAVRRSFRGTVVRAKMSKTAVVRVARSLWHPKYHRQYRVSRTFKIHDEKNVCKVGDVVEFVETRPLSKEKRWRLLRVLHSSGT